MSKVRDPAMRDAGGKAAFDAFWKGAKDWSVECDGAYNERWREFWCNIADKVCEAVELRQVE